MASGEPWEVSGHKSRESLTALPDELEGRFKQSFPNAALHARERGPRSRTQNTQGRENSRTGPVLLCNVSGQGSLQGLGLARWLRGSSRPPQQGQKPGTRETKKKRETKKAGEAKTSEVRNRQGRPRRRGRPRRLGYQDGDEHPQGAGGTVSNEVGRADCALLPVHAAETDPELTSQCSVVYGARQQQPPPPSPRSGYPLCVCTVGRLTQRELRH